MSPDWIVRNFSINLNSSLQMFWGDIFSQWKFWSSKTCWIFLATPRSPPPHLYGFGTAATWVWPENTTFTLYSQNNRNNVGRIWRGMVSPGLRSVESLVRWDEILDENSSPGSQGNLFNNWWAKGLTYWLLSSTMGDLWKPNSYKILPNQNLSVRPGSRCKCWCSTKHTINATKKI